MKKIRGFRSFTYIGYDLMCIAGCSGRRGISGCGLGVEIKVLVC
jgi:hypothetical protein